jgi:hypothetical protein
MVNCTVLGEYVKNYCGSCDYNWTLHKDYLFYCLDYKNNIECVNRCGIEVIGNLDWRFVLGIVGVFILLLMIAIRIKTKEDENKEKI